MTPDPLELQVLVDKLSQLGYAIGVNVWLKLAAPDTNRTSDNAKKLLDS